MQRRSAVLLIVFLACGLAGCGGGGGTAPLAVGSVGDPLVEAPEPLHDHRGDGSSRTGDNGGHDPTRRRLASPPATAAPATTKPAPLVLPTTPPTVPLPVAPVVAQTPAAGCDPSYPGVCIPPGPPDLDCADVSYRRFAVVGADPHRFDADGDGIGCESG